jgi:hypothetical protein
MAHKLGVAAAVRVAMVQIKQLLVLALTAVLALTLSRLGQRRHQLATLVILLVVAQVGGAAVMEPLAWAVVVLRKPTAQQTQEAAQAVTMGHYVLAALAS